MTTLLEHVLESTTGIKAADDSAIDYTKVPVDTFVSVDGSPSTYGDFGGTRLPTAVNRALCA